MSNKLRYASPVKCLSKINLLCKQKSSRIRIEILPELSEWTLTVHGSIMNLRGHVKDNRIFPVLEKTKARHFPRAWCWGPGRGTSLCRVYGYVPPTRVDVSLPKIQNMSQILNFFPEQALIFKVLFRKKDSFLTIWSTNSPAQMSKIPVAFLKMIDSIPIFFLKSMPIF